MNFKMTLRVSHPSIDPQAITAELSLAPTNSYKNGESRSTPKGNPLSGNYNHSFWAHELVTEGCADISDAINKANEKIGLHREFMANIVEGGGSIQYFVGWFIDGSSGEILSWKLLKDCSDLNVDIYFDVYS